MKEGVWETVTCSELETQQLGRSFAEILKIGDKVSLSGELGSGKTVFVRGVAVGLAYPGNVTSPTFAIVHDYSTQIPIYHIDCFRLRRMSDIISVGLDDYFTENSIALVEWGELILDIYSDWTFKAQFDFIEGQEDQRRIRFTCGREDESIARLNRFINQAKGLPDSIL